MTFTYAVYNQLFNKNVKILVMIAVESHLFPYRTQKLSPLAPKVLAWKRAGRLGNRGVFLFFVIFNLYVCYDKIMEYKIIKQRSKHIVDNKITEELTKQFSISYLCAQYLAQRGIIAFDDVEQYMHPNKKYLNDPFMFSDMQRSVDRINDAIDKKEKIVIYADYDCDGICAAVILYKALHAKTDNVESFIPHRIDDGYGMNIKRIEEIASKGARLIITVDNGITALEEIEAANKNGIDVIVTDHHEPLESVPEAYSIIDPKLENESYPFNELCGAGIALKLSQALGIERDLYDELLSFAAIATISDVMPLTDENRVIVSIGINNLKHNLNKGLVTLINTAKLQSDKITAGNISFQIAPRINASGRMQDASIAFKLFTSNDEEEIKELSEKLDLLNEERKNIETDIEDKCDEIIDKYSLLENQNVIFVSIPNAHQGVVGIAAGKITEKYHRPSVVGGLKDGIITASARSIPGFNIFEALYVGEDLFIKFGGHNQAAGFTIKENDFNTLADRVNEKAISMGISSYLFRTCVYDVIITESSITDRAVKEIEQFAPFGIKNPRPVFKLDDVSIRNISYNGSNSQHVRCNILSKSNNISAIAFFATDMFENRDFDNCTYDVIFTLSMNTFNSASYIQAELKDISEHVSCPEMYYESLYKHFNANANTAFCYRPEDDEITKDCPETLLYPSEKLFIVYGVDMLMRVIRYSSYLSQEININYSTFTSFDKAKINLLVNPTEKNFDNISQEIVVLDEPCFCGYESRLYNGIMNKRFLKASRYIPDIFIDRDYIAFIYKKLRILEYLKNDWRAFIDFLNKDSDMHVNYFTFRICFDIMVEMDILEYEIIDDKVYVDFKPIEGNIDINKSTVMTKINGFDSKKGE